MLEFRRRFILAKVRNLKYYFDNDSRPNVSYMMPVRALRENIKSYLQDNPSDELILRLFKLISPKIKGRDCKEIIYKLNNELK